MIVNSMLTNKVCNIKQHNGKQVKYVFLYRIVQITGSMTPEVSHIKITATPTLMVKIKIYCYVAIWDLLFYGTVSLDDPNNRSSDMIQ